jgi:hypothetical protein
MLVNFFANNINIYIISFVHSFIPIADHVFEIQMLNNHLGKHGLDYKYAFCSDSIIRTQLFLLSTTRGLDPELQAKVKDILNDAHNMAPVPARINRGVLRLSLAEHVITFLYSLLP